MSTPVSRSLVVLTLGILAAVRPCLGLGEEKSATDLSEAFRLIDMWLGAQRDYDRLPGLSVGVVRDQELLWSKGYGLADTEREVQAGAGTIYSICSISKLFTAIAVMQLRDAGKLRLDDAVADVLPWFNLRIRHEDSGPITIRSLLTHSSGLPRESAQPYWTGPEEFPFPTVDELKATLGKQETLYPASTYFQYSNLGLTLLGEIVAEVAGVPYQEYVEKRILTPLRLADTRTYLPESLWRGRLATGYSALSRDGRRRMLELFQARGITAAAGYSSTVEDLARFASWQFRLLERGGEEILKASTLREMHRVHWMDPDWKTAWGLGFSVRELDGRSIVGHGGSCPGYRTALELDLARKLACIVMINAQGTNPTLYTKGIRDILKKAGAGAGRTEAEASSPAKDTEEKADGDPVDLEPFAGLYDAQPWWGEMAVAPWQGKLVLFSLPSKNPAEHLTFLQWIEGDTFRRVRDDDQLGETVRFERDAAGKVSRMWRHSNYRRKIR